MSWLQMIILVAVVIAVFIMMRRPASRVCPHCLARNRFIARYCATCGRELRSLGSR
jgi:predicted amidophosphoribosyltransferase